ncbi:type 11 methyltransferase [Bryobacterales bacterium F-183]|nr:type 11 methyltransferase [Bryobacterales bacterium F-183]
MATTDYGIDAPQTLSNLYWRAGTFAAFGIGIYMMNRRELPGPAFTLMLVLLLIAAGFLAVAILMRQASQTGKLALRDTIINKIQWTGEEKVLDVGCGRGLLLIAAAKQLKKGRATGVDIWDPASLSANSQQNTIAMAKAEGVADRVKVETGDARNLTYGDNSFDVVLSSTTLHELPDAENRQLAIEEMVRVTKPGGQIAIFDVMHAGEYAEVLRNAGVEQIDDSHKTWLWLVPGRLVVGRKKA